MSNSQPIKVISDKIKKKINKRIKKYRFEKNEDMKRK